jgi:ADP-heptose:LPS heptosyltransferase
MATPTRICIARGDALGDLILATVLIAPLKAAYPDCEIYVIASGLMYKAIENHPDITGVIIDPFPYNTGLKETNKMLRFSAQLRRYNFDIFIGAWRATRYSILAKLAQIPVRVGHPHSLINKMLYTHLTPYSTIQHNLHHTQENLALLQALGHDVDPLTPTSLAPWAKEELDSPSPIAPKICVHLESGNVQKTMLNSDFVLLVQRLLHWIQEGKYGLERHTQIMLLGRMESKSAADAILKATQFHPLVVTKVDQLCLQQLQRVISSCDLFIGADSGLAHMAAAYKRRSVVYFVNKNQNVMEWAPWQTPHRLVMAHYQCPLVCRSGSCRLLTCREGIHVSQLLDASKELLTEASPEIPPLSYWDRFGYRVLLCNSGDPIDSSDLDSKGIHYWSLPSTAPLTDIVSTLVTHNINRIRSNSPLSFKWRLALWRAANHMHWPPSLEN